MVTKKIQLGVMERDDVRGIWCSSFHPSRTASERANLTRLLRMEFEEKTRLFAEKELELVMYSRPETPYLSSMRELGATFHSLESLPENVVIMPILAGGFLPGAHVAAEMQALNKQFETVFISFTYHEKENLVGMADKVLIKSADVERLRQDTKRSILLIDDIAEKKITLVVIRGYLRDLGFNNVFHTLTCDLRNLGETPNFEKPVTFIEPTIYERLSYALLKSRRIKA